MLINEHNDEVDNKLPDGYVHVYDLGVDESSTVGHLRIFFTAMLKACLTEMIKQDMKVNAWRRNEINKKRRELGSPFAARLQRQFYYKEEQELNAIIRDMNKTSAIFNYKTNALYIDKGTKLLNVRKLVYSFINDAKDKADDFDKISKGFSALLTLIKSDEEAYKQAENFMVRRTNIIKREKEIKKLEGEELAKYIDIDTNYEDFEPQEEDILVTPYSRPFSMINKDTDKLLVDSPVTTEIKELSDTYDFIKDDSLVVKRQKK